MNKGAGWDAIRDGDTKTNKTGTITIPDITRIQETMTARVLNCAKAF
jgi:hypothetical protein